IGINTGEAVVSLRARPELGEGIVAGSVVNVASRLQTVAPVGCVVVGEQTYLATENVFEYRKLRPAKIKGKAEVVPLWRALAARSRVGSDTTRVHAAPMVGRELDLAVLKGAFERAVRDRAVEFVTVDGEP